MDTPGEPGASEDDVQLSAPASASPRLRRILDKYASELLASSFDNGQQVSIMDLSFNEPADFTCRGRHVLNEATQVAKKSMQASLDAARDLQSRKDFMHNSPHMAKMVSKSTPILPPAPPGLSVLSSTASGKKPRITEPTSAMRKEDDAKLQASRACLEVMGMAQRKAALQGFDIVPLAEAVVSVQDALILAGAVGTMLNACSSIRKLKIWLVSRFGGDLEFVCPEAVVSWFLRDHKIGGTETVAGNVPQNLRSGLVWAHKHMGFASVQCMESDAVKGADSRAARRPVPAVSASVRMWYILWSNWHAMRTLRLWSATTQRLFVFALLQPCAESMLRGRRLFKNLQSSGIARRMTRRLEGAGSPCLGPCVLPRFRTPRGGRPLISIGRTTFCFLLYPATGFSTRVSPRWMPRRRLRIYCGTFGICLRMCVLPTLVFAKSFAGTLSGTFWRIVHALWVSPERSLSSWGVGVGLK